MLVHRFRSSQPWLLLYLLRSPRPFLPPPVPRNTGRRGTLFLSPMSASAPATALPPARVDQALEIAYEAAFRLRPRSAGPELWAGPHQLLAVAPKGGLLFHQPGCPRAGPTHQARITPLTRALRQSRQSCPLCWPLHRPTGCLNVGYRPNGCLPRAARPLKIETAPRHPCLTLCHPRLPSPWTRLSEGPTSLRLHRRMSGALHDYQGGARPSSTLLM